MTTRQRELVQFTWEYLLPMSGITGELFYSALFRRDSSLRDFPADPIVSQKRSLVPGVSILIRVLDEPGELVAVARRVCSRPPACNLKYAAPGAILAALLDVLRELLGPLYNPEIEAAWIAAYDFVVEVTTEAPAAALDHA